MTLRHTVRARGRTGLRRKRFTPGIQRFRGYSPMEDDKTRGEPGKPSQPDSLTRVTTVPTAVKVRKA